MHLEASLKDIREVIFIFRIYFSFYRHLQCKPLNLRLNLRQGVIDANEAVTRKNLELEIIAIADSIMLWTDTNGRFFFIESFLLRTRRKRELLLSS